jgi:hypothetical protein
VIVRMENLVEWMAGESEVLGENLPRRHFVHHKSHLTRPGTEPGPPRWENRPLAPRIINADTLINGDEWSASHSRRLTFGEKAHGTQ